MSLLERTQKFQDQVMNGHHEENKKEFMKYVRHVRAFTLFIWCMVFTACNLFVLPGYLALFDINNRIDKDGTVTKQMAFSCYLYFDQQKHHTIAVFIQLLISVPGATYIGAWDTFIFALMTSGICQMKMLQNLLISLGQNKNKSIHESVVECVQLHQEIIQYISDLDELTSNVFFLDFLMYAALLCSIGYRAFFDPDVDMTLVITSSAYILAILVQLYMFYWNGHIIMEESEEIANAVWKSNWYHHDKSVLKSLLIIMIRAQKPMKLTVGLFNVLNVETSVIILRAWYSYMTILNTMEED